MHQASTPPRPERVKDARPRSELVLEYVSTDCPTGQITLTLARDGRFTLVLEIWDPVVDDHVGLSTLTGHWSVQRGRLELTARARNLSYGLVPSDDADSESGTVSALRWERSNLPTFADGFTLIARR